MLKEKSYAFAIRIVKLSQHFQNSFKEYTLSRQILRSGTAVGALVREAEFGQSRADFANKMHIALKEANETEYWLCLLHDTSFLEKPMFTSMQKDCKELIAMLVSSVKTANHNKKS